MKPITSNIRKIIKNIPGAWVRVFEDNTIYVGHSTRYRTKKTNPYMGDLQKVKAALENAGYKTQPLDTDKSILKVTKTDFTHRSLR